MMSVLQRRINDAKRDVWDISAAYQRNPTLEQRNELRVAKDYLASLINCDGDEEDRMEARNERRMNYSA